MARKNKLFEVDIRKENPLKTILKNGKIPIVRISKTGFQNYKQDKYYESRKKYFDENTKLKRGCFVHFGGARGVYVSGNHYKETINIGYIEPNTKVFSTFSFQKDFKEFSYTRAKDRLRDMIQNYQKFLKTNDYDPEDFDVYAEAIVDTKDIVKVLTIESKDIYLLLPYVNDKYFSIFNVDIIFDIMSNYLPESFWNYFDFTLDEVNADFSYMDKELTSFYSYYEFYPFFKNLIKKEFVNFYTKGFFINSHEYYIKLKKAILTWHNYLKEIEDISFHFIDTKIVSINLRYKENIRTCSVYYSNFDKQEFVFNIEYLFSTKTSHLTENELFFNEYKNGWYKVLENIEYLKTLFYGLIDFEIPTCFKKLKKYYDLEKKLCDVNYKITNEGIVIIKEDNYSIEYNLTLLDAIITIPNSEKLYYNIENVPNYIIDDNFRNYLKVLSSWKYL